MLPDRIYSMVQFSSLFSFSRLDVKHAFAHGKVLCRGKQMKITQAPAPSHTPDLNHAKLLIVVPRRVGKAHERNLLRRRIKEIFYQHKLLEGNPALFVIFTYPGSTQHSFQDLVTFFTNAFKQVKAS